MSLCKVLARPVRGSRTLMTLRLYRNRPVRRSTLSLSEKRSERTMTGCRFMLPQDVPSIEEPARMRRGKRVQGVGERC